MSLARLRYRAGQFWKALGARPSPASQELAARTLASGQFALFSQLQPSEQAHSLEMLQALLDQGERDPDLLAAALLHDAGKSCYPLALWERVLIVLARHLAPERAVHWGQAWKPQPEASLYRRLRERWQRSFAVALRHPDWGANMAAEAGASERCVRLIRRHQDPLPSGPAGAPDIEESLLRKLQAVDENH